MKTLHPQSLRPQDILKTDTMHHAFMAGCVVLYLVAIFLFPNLMPERSTYDTQRLYDMMDNVLEAQADGSYAGTLLLLKFIPTFLLMPFIGALGSASILAVTSVCRAAWMRAMAAVYLFPLLVMSLFRPQKEMFVVLIALGVLAAAAKAPKKWVFFAVTAALYGGYAVVVRSYFALIFAVFVGFVVFFNLKGGWRVVLVLLAAALVLCLPESVATALIGVRDASNIVRDPLAEGNRTMFFNAWNTYSGFAFIGNYLYALARLCVPILFSRGFSEIFLMLTLGMYAWFVKLQGSRNTRGGDDVNNKDNWRGRYLAYLFGAHFVVLVLFEPDLGSFLRHLSSVCLYLLPALIVLARRAGTPIPKLLEKL